MREDVSQSFHSKRLGRAAYLRQLLHLGWQGNVCFPALTYDQVSLPCFLYGSPSADLFPSPPPKTLDNRLSPPIFRVKPTPQGVYNLHCIPGLTVHPGVPSLSSLATQYLSTAWHSVGLPQSQSSPCTTILLPQYEPLLWAGNTIQDFISAVFWRGYWELVQRGKGR